MKHSKAKFFKEVSKASLTQTSELQQFLLSREECLSIQKDREETKIYFLRLFFPAMLGAETPHQEVFQFLPNFLQFIRQLQSY